MNDGDAGAVAGRRRPGLRAVDRSRFATAHTWIDDEDGNRDALRKLVAPGRFLLVAGEEGDAWYAAARGLAGAAEDQAGSGASHGTFPETQCVRRAASLPRCRCRGSVAKVA